MRARAHLGPDPLPRRAFIACSISARAPSGGGYYVARGQTAFFRFSLWWRKNGKSGLATRELIAIVYTWHDFEGHHSCKHFVTLNSNLQLVQELGFIVKEWICRYHL